MTNTHTTTTDKELFAQCKELATAFVNINRADYKKELCTMLRTAFDLCQSIPNATQRLLELVEAYKLKTFKELRHRLQRFIDILSASEFSCLSIHLGWKGRTLKANFFTMSEKVELSASGGGYNFEDNIISRALNRHKEFQKFLIQNPNFPRVSFHAGIPYIEYECLGEMAFCEQLKMRGWKLAGYHSSFARDYHGNLARVIFSKYND